MAVTPVRMLSPRMRVVFPTVTPVTSVIAFNGPTGKIPIVRPASRARGRSSRRCAAPVAASGPQIVVSANQTIRWVLTLINFCSIFRLVCEEGDQRGNSQPEQSLHQEEQKAEHTDLFEPVIYSHLGMAEPP